MNINLDMGYKIYLLLVFSCLSFITQAQTGIGTTNLRFYRITLMVGPGYTNNFISIERLL